MEMTVQNILELEQQTPESIKNQIGISIGNDQ